MYSKFSTTASMILNFDRIDDPRKDYAGADPFCQHIAHLFIQLSMMVLLKLHAGQPLEADWDALILGQLQEQLGACHLQQQIRAKRNTVRAGSRITGHHGAQLARQSSRRLQQVAREAATPPPGASRGNSKRRAAFGRMSLLGQKPLDLTASHGGEGELGGLGGLGAPPPRRASVEGRRRSLHTTLRTNMSENEIRALKQATCPVTVVAHRILRAITTRMRARNWQTPAPLAARMYNTLEDGLTSYHSAFKLKEVPIPFAFVQLNAVLLLVFNLLVPVAVACFSSAISMAVLTSVVVTGAFSAMWLVANEMEDPFGTEAIHLDLRMFHAAFVGSLRDMMHSTQFEEDTWTVGQGPWRPPTSGAMAAGVWGPDDHRLEESEGDGALDGGSLGAAGSDDPLANAVVHSFQGGRRNRGQCEAPPASAGQTRASRRTDGATGSPHGVRTNGSRRRPAAGGLGVASKEPPPRLRRDIIDAAGPCSSVALSALCAPNLLAADTPAAVCAAGTAALEPAASSAAREAASGTPRATTTDLASATAPNDVMTGARRAAPASAASAAVQRQKRRPSVSHGAAVRQVQPSATPIATALAVEPPSPQSTPDSVEGVASSAGGAIRAGSSTTSTEEATSPGSSADPTNAGAPTCAGTGMSLAA